MRGKGDFRNIKLFYNLKICIDSNLKLRLKAFASKREF